MTAPVQIDPFAGGDKAEGLKFPTVGTTYKGTITQPPNLIQGRDYETGNPATWPDGNPRMVAVLNLEVNGEERALWAPKPSAMFAALKEAQRAAGKAFEVGGTLAIKYTGDKPNEKNPRLNPQKQYAAQYTPPAPKDVFAEADPFGGGSDDAPF